MTHDLTRYNRQMLLAGIGEAGQQRLSRSTVLLLGCGALGSVAADLLSRAGIGRLTIVDRDVVELSNLQRQVLFGERDVAERMPKAEAAKRHIARTNADVRVTAIVDDINPSNIEQLAKDADALVDGLDNFETRYLANDVAVKRGKPYIYGAAVASTGMAFTVLPHGSGDLPWESGPDGNFATPCFRCLFEEPPPTGSTPSCDTVGVLGSATSIVAGFQVAEALKVLTGNYAAVRRSMLRLDLWTNEFLELETGDAYEKGDCPCCQQKRFDYLEGRVGSSATALCGRDAIQLRHRQQVEPVDLASLARRLQAHGEVSVNDFALRADITDGNNSYEITLFPDGRAIIKGTQDEKIARAVYARYIGS